MPPRSERMSAQPESTEVPTFNRLNRAVQNFLLEPTTENALTVLDLAQEYVKGDYPIKQRDSLAVSLAPFWKELYKQKELSK